MKALLRFLLGLALLPICGGVAAAFFSMLLSFSGFSASHYPFVLGFLTYALIHVLLYKPLRTYVFGHELTHALASLMLGGRVKSFKVTKRGGSVVLTKTNLFVALAPYCFPIYTAFVILAFCAASFFWPIEKFHGLFLYALGFSLAFHLFLTVFALLQGQPDMRQGGIFLSVNIVFLSNVIMVVFVLSLLFPQISMTRFAKDSFGKTQNLCLWITANSITTWNHITHSLAARG